MTIANLSPHYPRCNSMMIEKDMTMTAEENTPWSYAQVATLWEQARRHASLHEIALLLSKSEAEVLQKAEELGVPMDHMWPDSGEQKFQSSGSG